MEQMRKENNGKNIFDPYDMDREEFNPAMYMLRYSEECSLPNMFLRQGHIEKEIKVINSDLQNLLYDNYKKIDSVTAVITDMKTNFVEMEENIGNLSDETNGIIRTSSNILEKLKPNKNKMSKLLKSQDVIKKLSLFTDLVPTMKMHVDLGMHDAAARHYLKAEKILTKYKHFSSISGIMKECSEIIAEIKSALRNKLNFEMHERKELTDTLFLLLALRELPEALMKHFLFRGGEYLESVLISMDEIWAKASPEDNGNHFQNEISIYINSCCNYIVKMSNVLEVSKWVFQPHKDLSSILATSLKEFFLEYMDRLQTKILHHMEEYFQKMDDDYLAQLLDKFIRQCHKSGLINSQINFNSEGLNIVLQVCVCRCEIYLQTMKKDFDAQLVKQAEELSPRKNASDLVLFLIEWTENKLMAVLLAVVPYMRPEFRFCREITFRNVFCKVIVREATFVAFLKYIFSRLWLFLTAEGVRCFSKPLLCAVIAKFLFEFRNFVPNFLSKVDDCLSSDPENLPVTSAESIILEFKTTALKVLGLYIHIRCQSLTCMIKSSMENRDWMTSKEPKRPRPVIKMVLKDLMEAKLEIEKIFGASQSPARKRGSDIGNAILCDMYSSYCHSKATMIEKKVILNKTFFEFSTSLTKVELNAPSIVNALLKSILISFIQLIRLKTLNHYSLQQIQVDVYYMQYHLPEFIELDPIIQVLFDEIICSACNRAVNPQMMSSHVVRAICNDTL